MLRGKDVTRAVTVPVSAGLLADVDSYHEALTSYRAGDVGPIVEQISVASTDALLNARVLVADLRQLREQWMEAAKPRPGSQLSRLIAFALRQPVFTASAAADHLGIAAPNAYPHLRKLVELDILQQKTEYKMGQVYRSDDVLRAVDHFAERAGRRRGV
jgi:Fic family protein